MKEEEVKGVAGERQKKTFSLVLSTKKTHMKYLYGCT